MRLYLWLAAAVLLAAAAFGVWWAFQSPQFVAGLVALAGGAIWKALSALANAQIAKDMLDPEVDRKNKEAAKKPAGPVHEGTGVTTGKVIKQPAATKRNRPKP